jgi:hypothetical protein
MTGLSTIEEESLAVLKQLEYCCDTAELRNPQLTRDRKFLWISYKEINFSTIGKPENIVNVEKYLQQNGVDFYLSLDFINDDPTVLEVSLDPMALDTQLAVINGNDIQEIKASIVNLMNKLIAKSAIHTQTIITYNINIGQFKFSTGTVTVEGNQKDAVDCLVEEGVDKKVSWDVIFEAFKNDMDGVAMPADRKKRARQKRSVSTAVTEVNKKTNKYLDPNKDLIARKDNEYWLEYVVDKGR